MSKPGDATSLRSDLIARDLDVLWHPCAQMRDYREFPPLEVIEASGCRITLADGRQVLDAISSWWCKSLGHRHPRLMRAIAAQAERFEHVILANTTNEPVVRLCERLLAAGNGYGAEVWGADAPGPAGRRGGHFGKVFLADNGSTAVEVAIKMALQAQRQSGRGGRTRFAALRNGYHGETVGAMSVGDCGLYVQPYEMLLFDVMKLDGVPYRNGPDDPRWMDASAEWQAIERQLDPMADELAAIVYEPVLQGAGGMLLYSPDLLPRLRRWADAHEVYLIADEIAAGMGRCGAMLASHLASCDKPTVALPDFAVLSKGLTGGVLPLSAVLTTDAVYDVFDADYIEMRSFLHSNTFTGNALAVAAANAVLDVFDQERVLEQVARRGPLLREALREIAADRPYLKNIRGVGMMAAADIRSPDGSPLGWKLRTGYRVYQEAVRRGALLRPLGDTMYLFPPLNTVKADINTIAAILADSLDALMG